MMTAFPIRSTRRAPDLLLVLSLTYVFATMQVRFRDTQYLLGIALFLLFYLTPVFWDASKVSEPYRGLMNLNPIAVLLNAYRAILVRGEWPDVAPLLMVAGASAIALMMSFGLFSLVRNRFAEEL